MRCSLMARRIWKNGSQHYMPEWMKLQPERYSHVTNKNGELVDSPSPFANASLDADIHAFTAFMLRLKEADSQRTVLMVQVENETGTWGTLRDYSPGAEKMFQSPVPADVAPSALIDRKWQHRQFLRVEEGTYENGLFKFQRILNGDQTDWGLDFGSEPQVLRVSVATY